MNAQRKDEGLGLWLWPCLVMSIMGGFRVLTVPPAQPTGGRGRRARVAGRQFETRCTVFKFGNQPLLSTRHRVRLDSHESVIRLNSYERRQLERKQKKAEKKRKGNAGKQKKRQDKGPSQPGWARFHQPCIWGSLASETCLQQQRELSMN